VPVGDDQKLFEKLVLEGFQSGLSWLTILRKRENYHRLFDGFDPARVAAYDEARRAVLLADAGIVRNRAKIAAAIGNARACLAVQREFGSLDAFLWRFIDGRPRVNRWERLADVPAQSAESAVMSKELARRGFRFVGPTICYAFMQAVGMVNDHTTDCFRHAQLAGR
jgi:DNA-3-methyladenine glycosylase I